MPPPARSRLPASARAAHKTDSTLRGNWADELAARSCEMPVLLVPSLPAMGRTCADGVVLDHGRPVHEGSAGTDVRRRVLTSRPAEALRSAGAGEVAALGDVEAVARGSRTLSAWRSPTRATTRPSMASSPRWIAATDGVILAGTSAVVGAAAEVVGRHDPAEPMGPVDGPILVVCGSVHPAARAPDRGRRAPGPAGRRTIADDITARSLAEAGVLVLATEIPVGDVDEPVAVAAAAGLARGCVELRRRGRARCVGDHRWRHGCGRARTRRCDRSRVGRPGYRLGHGRGARRSDRHDDRAVSVPITRCVELLRSLRRP